MVSEGIINYLREGLKGGHAISLLRRTLIDGGWPEGDIDSAIGEIQGENVARPGYSALGEKLEKKDVHLNREPVKGKERPIGIAIVAILHWVIAASIVFSAIKSIYSTDSLTGIFALLSGFLAGALVVISLVIALLPLLVGVGIWKGNNGSRVTAIIFGIIFTLFGIFALFNPTVMGILNLLNSIFIAGYLLFGKKAKAYFSK